MDLSRISTKALEAELARRQGTPTDVGKDWYYSFNEDSLPEYPTFYVVHKRHWHLNHCLYDGHVDHILAMPHGFNESMESCFEFDGSKEEAAKQLEKHGFTLLPEWGLSLVVQCMKIAGVSWRIHIHPDTPELQALLEAEMKNFREEWESLDAYKDWMRSITPADCVVGWHYEYDQQTYGGGDGYLMKKEAFDKLPPEIDYDQES